MAREVIGSIWDRTNRNSINANFEELFNDLGTATGTKDKLDNFLNGTGVVTPKMLQTNAVYGDIIKENGIGTRHLLDGTVTNSKLGPHSVTQAKIAPEAITESKYANRSVSERVLALRAVTNQHLATGAVDEAAIGPHAVNQYKIAPEAVTESKLGNRAVSSRALALRSVTEQHILENSITNVLIGPHAVSQTKIAPEAVTESKLGSRAVSNRALGLRSVDPNNTSFIKDTNKNLFNPLNIHNNKVVNFTSGSLTDSNDWVTSEEIPVESGRTYSLSQVYYLVFKDGSGNKIGDVVSSPYIALNQVTAPSNARTMQFSVRKSDFNNLYDFVAILGSQYTFDAFGHELAHAKYRDDSINVNAVEFMQRTSEHNLVNIYNDYRISEKGVMKSYTNGTTVSTESTTEYRFTDFIVVKPNTYLLRKYPRHFVFYDKNKIFISGTNTPSEATRENIKGYGVSVPSNAKYVVLNVRENEQDEFLLQVRNESESVRIPELIIGKHQIVDDGFYGYDEDKHLQGKVGVAFGDSITQGGTYTDYISNVTGANYINVGFGSTRLARTNRENYPWKDIGMCDLTDAITSGNWALTDSAIAEIDAYYGNTTYSTIYNRLKSIDFNTVDFITFMYGTNDANNSVFEIGTPDSTDTYTVNGALNYILQTLITTYPHIKVYALSPIFRQTLSGWGDGDSDNSKLPNGVYLYDIAQAIVDKAKEYHIPVKDMYNESGINRYNADHFLKDGVHPGDAGNQLMNEVIYKYLQSY